MLGGEPDLQLDLDRVITAPHVARAELRRLLGANGDSRFWQSALLAASEIVTHSLTHASGLCRLAAWFSADSGWLRVEVTDGGGEMPSLVSDGRHSEVGGLRLAVLDQVPAAWGVDNGPFGRCVWFEMQAAHAV